MPDPSAEDRARMRGYLVGQAQKYDLVDLWPRIVGQRLAFLDAIEGLTDEQARWRPPSGEGEDAWSALEVTQHLVGWTRNVLEMVEAMARGTEGAKLPPGHLDADPSQTLAQARRDLVDVTMRLSALMARPDLDAGEAVVEHAWFGPLGVRGWLLFQRIHDVDHVTQVGKLKAMDGFPRGDA